MIQAIINGQTHNFDTFFKVTDFVIASPSFEYYSDKIEYQLGKVIGGRTLNDRELTITGTITGNYDTAYRNIMKTFSIDEYYIYDTKQPNQIWLVNPSSITITRLSPTVGTVEIKCICHSGHAESKTTITKTFTASTFTLQNEGDIEINPRMHDLKIDINGTGSNITITNLTTNESIVINTALTSSDTISIDRYFYKKNNALITSSTNRKLLSIAPGDNQFKIIGVTNPNIKFTFKQYYY